MENPYETPLSPRAKPDLKRWVFRYTFACALLLVVGVCSALPGLVLLNQELGWIPVNGKIYDIEISGESVRLETAMRNSLTTGSMLGAIGMLTELKPNVRIHRIENFEVDSTPIAANI